MTTTKTAVPLLDVPDIQGYVAWIIHDEEKSGKVSFHNNYDREDCSQYLLEQALEMAETFTYHGEGHPTFTAYCNKYLRLRIMNWFRQTFGDKRYESNRVEVLHLEAMNGDRPLLETVPDPDEDFTVAVDNSLSLQDEFSGLTDKGRWILEFVARPISQGQTHKQVAAKLGRSPKYVTEAMSYLRTELEECRSDLA